jgi:glycosyltransferase involved in cell wall biosynthesis
MTEEWPAFSIIVPTYNRPQQLMRCLKALAALDYPVERFEVIIVNDGGPALINSIVAEFEAQLCVHYIVQPNQGPAVARNNGAKLANGRFLAFTDDDCAPTATWLRQLAIQLMKEPHKMVGGYTRNALHRNPFSITSQLLIDFLYHYYNQTESRALFFTSNNFAIAADLFWHVGGFDETMPLAAGEDRELCDRWLDHGYEMIYLPRAIVFHEHYLHVFSFWRQHFNYGRGAWLYRWLRSQRKQEAVHLEPPDFYLKLVSYPLTMARDIRAYILTGMLCFTQAANATGFFYERFLWARRQKKKLPVREPFR